MSFTRGEIIPPTELKSTANASNVEIKSSITIDDVKEGVAHVNGSPNKPSSKELLSLHCTFPLCSTTSSQGTLLPDLRTNPSMVSFQSHRAPDTGLPRHYRSSRPPRPAGAMGSDTPHWRETPATEDDTLNRGSEHADSASTTPHRVDNPDGPGSTQGDRNLPRRDSLNEEASNAAACHETTLDPKGDLTHSPVILSVPAIYAHGRGCCQQSPSPTSVVADGWFPAVQLGSARCARGGESAGGHSEQERWTRARVGRSGSVARVGRYLLSDNGEGARQRAARQSGSEGQVELVSGRESTSQLEGSKSRSGGPERESAGAAAAARARQQVDIV